MSQTMQIEVVLIEKCYFDVFCHVFYDVETNVEDAVKGETLLSKAFSLKGEIMSASVSLDECQLSVNGVLFKKINDFSM